MIKSKKAEPEILIETLLEGISRFENKKSMNKPKETAEKKKEKPDGKEEKLEAKKEEKTKKIIEAIDDVAEDERWTSDKKRHKISGSYSSIIFQQQYQQALDQYRKFLDAYLREYNGVSENKDGVILEYDDSARKEKLRGTFKWGEEVMTHAEVRDIVLRKRMNWMLGGEHNYVSPDEKERYKFWKMCNKFNYIMAEGCWFQL